MPRRRKRRIIKAVPSVDFYKPRGIPLRELEINMLTLDETEALRLRDLEGLSMEDAAKEMGVSRRTFARILKAARYKIVDALFHGKAIGVRREI